MKKELMLDLAGFYQRLAAREFRANEEHSRFQPNSISCGRSSYITAYWYKMARELMGIEPPDYILGMHEVNGRIEWKPGKASEVYRRAGL